MQDTYFKIYGNGSVMMQECGFDELLPEMKSDTPPKAPDTISGTFSSISNNGRKNK